MNNINRRVLLGVALILAAALAIYGLMPRLNAEKSNKTVAFVTDYREIASLSYQNHESSYEIWQKVNPLGVMGVAAAEFTGDDLGINNPMPIRFGSAALLLAPGISYEDPNRAVLRYPTDLPYADIVWQYINIKFPAAEFKTEDDYNFILLPGTVGELKTSYIIPDIEALEFADENEIPVFFRPGPCTVSSGQNVADSLAFLKDKFPQIINIVPAGVMMAGYPDLAPIVSVMKEKGITLSQVEFIRQIGVPQLAKRLGSFVIPMHSLTRDEIISRNITRHTIVDRFVRAVHERSIRLIMVHPYDLQMGGRLDIFTKDLTLYKTALESRGYKLGIPEPIPVRTAPVEGAAACGVVFIFCLWSYISRLAASEKSPVGVVSALILFVASLLLGAAMWKVSAAAKLIGGFCGAFAATEGALTALESSNKRVTGAIEGLLIIFAGGLAIASFYGTSAAALRLTPFSGVKLTLLLPPIMVLWHDLTRRVHPETASEIIDRPAIWGELVVLGIMMLALLVMALRSGNVSNVPALEVAFRDFVERVMVVRPRTKEFMIGYPALVLYWYLVRSGWLKHYREAVRIAAVLAFCSAINTFCHFHTLLYLSVIRVLNGWWLGLLLGAIGVAVLHFVLIPLYRKLSSVGKSEREIAN